MTKSLSKKMGPLPVWAWGLIFGVVGFYLYERYSSSSSSTTGTAANPATLDPNAVDPNTGLTYGQEEADALNANASLSSSGTGTTPSLSDLSNELADVQSLFGLFASIAGELGYSKTPAGGKGGAFGLGGGKDTKGPTRGIRPPKPGGTFGRNPSPFKPKPPAGGFGGIPLGDTGVPASGSAAAMLVTPASPPTSMASAHFQQRPVHPVTPRNVGQRVT